MYFISTAVCRAREWKFYVQNWRILTLSGTHICHSGVVNGLLMHPWRTVILSHGGNLSLCIPTHAFLPSVMQTPWLIMNANCNTFSSISQSKYFPFWLTQCLTNAPILRSRGSTRLCVEIKTPKLLLTWFRLANGMGNTRYGSVKLPAQLYDHGLTDFARKRSQARSACIGR